MAPHSPYRTPAEAPESDDALVRRSPPYFALGVCLVAALRVVVAIATKEHCGADVGLATVVAALSARALVFRR